jgi:transposase
VHRNAKLTPTGRLQLVLALRRSRRPLAEIAQAFRVGVVTARKWLRRYETEGQSGLQDRSSRPARLRAPTPPKVVERIARLSRQRLSGVRIAEITGVSSATVSRVLKRLGRAHSSLTAIRRPR